MKLGVVLEGGACRCVFQAGALYELWREGVRFSHVTGVSAGALNGCAVVEGRSDELEDIWMGLRDTRIFNPRHILANWSPFDLSRITLEVIRRNFSIPKMIRSKIEFAVVTTRLPRFERMIYTNRQKVDFLSALRASNMIPILHSRPVFFEGAFHIDGGFIDNVPIDVPLEQGCDSVLIIVNNPRGRLYPKPFLPFSLLSRKTSHLRDRLIVLHPPRKLTPWPFDFRINSLREGFSMGRQAAVQLLKEGRFA